MAARLEALAEPGGVCISRTVYDQVHTRLELNFDYLGEHKVKNLAEPVRVYKVVLEPLAADHTAVEGTNRRAVDWRKTALAAAVLIVLGAGGLLGWNYYQQRSSEAALAAFKKGAALPLPEKPSIAVLAFDNLSGDAEQEFFSDGIAEDIITDLSRVGGLFVVARNSSFVFKGKPVDVAEVGQKLGVRYVLEGSVRKAGTRIRLSVQLIDAASRKHLWAERYDRELKDVFAVQDEITERIVSNLKVQLTMGEGERIRRNTTDSPEAWEYYRKGTEHSRGYNSGAHQLAREMFNKALELDPEFEAAMVGQGIVYAFAARAGWESGVPDPLERAQRLAEQALELDKTLAEPHRLLALINITRRKHDRALAASERAAAIEPNDPVIQHNLGFVRHLSGKHEAAVRNFLFSASKRPFVYL